MCPEWDEYTDEEILSLPFHLPLIISENNVIMMRRRIRNQLFRLRIFLLKDILIFKPNSSPHLQMRNSDSGIDLIKERLEKFFPGQVFEEGNRAANIYTYARSAMGDLRRIWPTV
jgi:hypothetical protein